MSKKQNTIAIVYDFDGTLAKGNIQENSYIPKLGISKKKFWNDVNALAEKNNMDGILAYMHLLIQKADENVEFTRKDLKAHGKGVKYFDGVETYFDFINKYAENKSLKIEHYIISSGTKEMIKGTSIAKEFEYIYASSFLYKANYPIWPSLAINYTNKTQFLFRINKGIKNVWDDSAINKPIPKEKRHIPFENMIYIGDGDTDIPAMKVVKMHGGHSIAVYAPNKKGKKEKIINFLDETRVNYIVGANYTNNSDLVKIIKSIIDRIANKKSILKAEKSVDSFSFATQKNNHSKTKSKSKAKAKVKVKQAKPKLQAGKIV